MGFTGDRSTDEMVVARTEVVAVEIEGMKDSRGILEMKMGRNLVCPKPGQKHEGSLLPMIAHNHIIALGLCNQLSGRSFL